MTPKPSIIQHTIMKSFFLLLSTASLLLVSCGGGEKNKELAAKRAALEKLKTEHAGIESQIKKLEEEIVRLDPASANVQKPRLVSVQELAAADFSHYIELQGRIESENISFVTPRGTGGVVKAILVKQGDRVRKGQLLMKLDDAIARQSLQAAKEGLETIRTQLSYARTIYQRQKNLWDQNIGTEIQLITAKNNVSTLENQLKTAEENMKVVQEQLNTSNVYSEVDGTADEVTIRVGEVFSAATANMLGIKIVNSDQLKVTGNIPENYLSNVHKGSVVEITVPDIGKTFSSSVSFIGAVINPQSRGFIVEARLPANAALKPYQVAMLRIRDYAANGAIAIPVATLQNDEKGKFVMVASREKSGLIARKRTVQTGFLNGNMLEIKSGLQPGDVLITEGFQSLYEGQSITTQQ